MDSRYEEMGRTELYDTKGNPVYTVTPFGNDRAYVYGYNGSLPIAQVEIPRDIPFRSYDGFQLEEMPFSLDFWDVFWAAPSIPANVDVTMTFNFNNVKQLEMSVAYLVFTETGVDFEIVGNISFSEPTETVSIQFQTQKEGVIYFMPEYYQPVSYNFSAESTASISWGQGEKIDGPSVFHTSFEDSGEGTALPAAKTGRHAKQGNYTINVSNFSPGEYVLTYWRSTDSGQTWVKHTKPVTVSAGTSSETITNASPGWIDEVRLIPRGAMIKTFTYRPDAGKTSETDHNGITRYWEYDDRGRVVQMLDNERRVLEEYFYNIKN
jgi:YD repeat-containing protein